MRSDIGSGMLPVAQWLLRPRRPNAEDNTLYPWKRVLLLSWLCALLYGAAMGTFSAVGHDRWLQVPMSAVKVPLLLFVSAGLALPSFYALNIILGLRDDFRTVLQALLLGQATLTLVLLSLSPLTVFFYATTVNYSAALVVNGLVFAVASLASHVQVRRAYAPLIARDPRHRVLLLAWLSTFMLVAIQMAWVLRPFVGKPHTPLRFFREHAWTNAYVEMLEVIGRAF